MTNENLIEASHLTRRFGPTLAVSDLSLILRPGEILGLLGPNGAGKTTTMNMLAGCLAPSQGDVRIHGVDLREDAQAAKRHLGYLPEQPPLYPELTVNEYLDFCAGLHGIASSARGAAVSRAQAACGLKQVARRLIGNLSKGYQQRVGLAQAIIHRPPVVILDEPTVGLDPIQIREIRALITELGREHSVILSSHILPEIQAVCDRVMIINGGRAVYDQPVEVASGFETIVARFRTPPEAAGLRAIAGVTGADPLEDGGFRLRCAEGSDPREALVQAAVSGNWGLLELRPEYRTLEEIFVGFTTGDDARIAAEARAA